MEYQQTAAAQKAYKGMGMEGAVARWYGRITRKDTPAIQALAARIAAAVASGAKVLEVAPGPGFLSIELAKRGLEVRAVDISETFVDMARRNAVLAGVQARFEVGNAAALPVPGASVDFVVCRAAFKNFTEPVKALAEMRRVLRAGGTALLIDLRRDVSAAEIKRYVEGMDVGWLNRQLMLLIFRNMLIKRAYSLDEIRRMATEAGWVNPRIEVGSVGFEAWMMK